MMRISLSFATLALTVDPTGPAFAVRPTGTLGSVERTGTVAADQAIPVMMRLTLDAEREFSAIEFQQQTAHGLRPRGHSDRGTVLQPGHTH